MDRARPIGACRTPGDGGFLRACVLCAAAAAACAPITIDLNRVIAIEVLGGTNQTVEQGGTLQLVATALDGSGDPVADATITWELIDIDSGQVGFTLDPSGLVTAVSLGSGRVQARFETLRAGPITITVREVAPDSIGPAGPQRVTLALADAMSPPLAVVVQDLTVSPPAPLPLAGQRVDFALAEPPPGSLAADALFLTETDVPGPDPHRVEVLTDQAGLASVVLRRANGGELPDSAVVDATLESVTGSPVRFVVLIERPPP